MTTETCSQSRYGGDDSDCDGDDGDDVEFDDGVEAGMPHIFDSVELTKFRLGLSGLHIFALSSGDICWASLEL